MLPSLARADEFDLMVKFGKLGDLERRDDERNLFSDPSGATGCSSCSPAAALRDNAAPPLER